MDWDKLKEFIPKNARVLDYGYGRGRICWEFCSKGFEDIIGVDSSHKMIEIAKNTYPSLDFRIIENSAYPFDDQIFDIVLLFTVLTSVPADEDQLAIISESYRVLRQGGVLYVSDLPLQKDKRTLDRYEKFASQYDTFGIFELPDGGVMRHHKMTWIKSLFKQFKELSLKEIDIITMNGNKAKGFQYLGLKA